MPKERQDLTNEEERHLTDDELGYYPNSPITEALTEDEQALKELKAKLPMLYTVYGNIVKVKTRPVTGKTFNAIRKRLDELKYSGGRVEVVGDGWRLILSDELSKALRLHDQIEPLYLAGWELVHHNG